MVKGKLKQNQLAKAVDGLTRVIRQQQRGEVRRRFELGSNIMALGNIAAGALLFGQAFSGFPFNFRLAVLGVMVLVLTYAWAMSLMKGGDR